MAGRPKPRSAANAERGAVAVSERVLRECHALYGEADTGLIEIADRLGLQLLPPRKKINVMLMGNHSAGKSSFINWYVEEHIQRTGVAIETQGFTFVTSGRKRESLTGNATLHLYPHFKPLQQIEGVAEYLTTEISASKQKKFSLVTFIDTPGLVDGDMKYPFNVDQAIVWLGELCELVFVFFDPMGQALCKRTLNIVERLNENQGDRMRFYLSKADEAGGESDRQRVMMQIVQELCKRPGLNKCGFEMPTIYIPHPNKSSRCVNQIDDVCRTIERTINQTVQTTLNQLERDCLLLIGTIDRKLLEDSVQRELNTKARSKGCLLAVLGLLLPAILLLSLVINDLSSDILSSFLGEDVSYVLQVYTGPFTMFWSLIPTDQISYVLLTLAVISLLLLLSARISFRTSRTLSKRQRRHLEAQRDFVQDVVKVNKRQLYEEYLRESVGEYEMP